MPRSPRPRSLRVYAALGLLALGAVLALAPTAASAPGTRCQAPPGTAAIDQYCENVPVPTGQGGGSPSGGGAIPPGTAGQLTSHGAGALLAQPGAPAKAGQHATRAEPPAPSGSPIDAIGAAVSDGDTIGGGLVWALLAIAVALGGAAWLRFRRRPPTPD